MPNLSKEQQAALIKIASERLGMSTEKINEMLTNGTVGNLAAKAGISIGQYMNNPAAIENLLKDPKTAALVKMLLGGK